MESLTKKIEEINLDLTLQLDSDNNGGISLLGGMSGGILFKYNYYKYFLKCPQEELLNRIEPYIVQLFDALNSSDYSFTYCDGMAGVSFLLNHLKRNGVFPEEIEDALKEFDQILISKIGPISSPDDTDFLHGQLGMIYYLTERLEQVKNNPLFAKNVALFIADIQHEVDLAETDDFKFINFGLAHGYLAYMKIIMRLISVPAFDKPNYYNLLKQLLRVVLKYKNESPESFSLFPSIIHPNKIPKNYTINLGWCYGDQPTALILFEIALFLNDEELKKEALSIAETWMVRDSISKGFHGEMVDACFCHGTTSAAYFNKKLFELTDENKYHENYEYFIEQTLKIGSQQNGASGYLKFEEDGVKRDFSLLGGTAGIGLVLIDFFAKEQTHWDKFFMLELNSNN